MKFPYWVILLFLVNLPKANSALKDQIQLNEGRFTSSVRPTLVSVTNDFYELLTFLRPEMDNLFTISQFNIKIKIEINHINKVCPVSPQKFCQASLNNIEYYLQKQEVEFAKIFSKKLCEIDYSQYCISAAHDLTESYLYNLKAQAKLKSKNFSELQLELDRLRAQTHVLIGQLIPDKEHKEIELVWVEFFRNIEEYFLTQNTPKLFLEWIDRLNFSINEFNMVVEQKEKILKPGFKGRVEQIHSRWNLMIREFL